MQQLIKLILINVFVIGILSCSPEDVSTEVDNDNAASEVTDEGNLTGEEGEQTETPGEPTEETEDPTEDGEETEESPVTVSGSVVDTYGQLSINGSNVVDKNNNPVQLRGMSLFWSQWMGQFYTAGAVKWLKDDWNATIVRAAMGVEDDGGYISNPDTEKAKVFAVIDAAIAEGIYVIVDWHSHHAEWNTEKAKTFFTEVAQKYGHYPNIIYETYNEPILNTDATAWVNIIKPYHEEIITEIRKYDSDNIIVCGTRIWSQAVSEVIGNEIDDANVAYTLHYYSSTHLKDGFVWSEAVKAINAGIPLFVTEFGVTSADGNGTINEEQANYWWDFLDTHKISWCNWSIADKDEASAALTPGASGTGNWSENQLTTSGQMVRNEMIEKNQDFE